MCFRAEVEVRSKCVLEELNREITSEEKGHCAHDSTSSAFALKRSRPNSDSFRQNFNKDRGQHKTCTEGNKVFKEAFPQSMGPGLNENDASDYISAGSKQAE